MFTTHDTVELHGLGNAIASAVEVAQALTSQHPFVLQRIFTSSLQTPEAKKPEITIILGKK